MCPAFDDLGGASLFEVTVDPEFPANGVWAEPVRHFHREHRCDGTEPFRSAWGSPLVVRVGPFGSAGWVGFVEAGGLHSSSFLVGGPGPHQLVAANSGCAFLIDVLDPQAYEVVPAMPIVGVQLLSEADLLLLTTFTDMVAIDSTGVRWRSDRVVLDDLRIVGSRDGLILASGSTLEGGEASAALDPANGLIVSESNPLFEPLRDNRHWLRTEES